MLRAPVLLLFTVACLESDGRPYQEWLDELEQTPIGDGNPEPTDSDPTDLPGPTEPPPDTGEPAPTYDQLCSEDGGAPIAVTFHNASPYHADLYWIDSACGLHNLVLIPAGTSAPLDTYVGHVFRLRTIVDVRWIAEVRIAAGDTDVFMGDAP